MYAYIFQALLTFKFINQILYEFSFSPVRTTCTAHLVLLDMVIRRLLGTTMNLIYDHNKSVVINREQSKCNSDERYVQFKF